MMKPSHMTAVWKNQKHFQWVTQARLYLPFLNKGWYSKQLNIFQQVFGGNFGVCVWGVCVCRGARDPYAPHLGPALL